MNTARILFLGMAKLNFTEEQMLSITPRKFFKVYDEYLIINGLKKDGDEYAMDALP